MRYGEQHVRRARGQRGSTHRESERVALARSSPRIVNPKGVRVERAREGGGGGAKKESALRQPPPKLLSIFE